jgi:imidazoleglycerol-phosphate dehydratase
MIKRKATITRNTLEFQITIMVNLDSSRHTNLDTPVPFLNHMLDQIARHGLIDLDIKAIGDKKGLTRYGHAYVPLDESLSHVVLDFSDQPGRFMTADFVRGHVGTFDVDLSREFFQGFLNHAFVTLHIDNIYGANAHHTGGDYF